MKTIMVRLLAATFVSLGLFLFTRAEDITFYAAQYSEDGANGVYQEGDTATDNPNLIEYTTAYSPATQLGMPFYDGGTGNCDFEAFFDTSVAKGTYYIGNFYGSTTNFYVYIY
jgi:hypothetical protein